MDLSSKSLTIVGSGIKSVSHLTQEAIAYIQESDKVFYLINEPIMAAWVAEKNPAAENLMSLYKKFPDRNRCYAAITAHVLAALEKFQHVCFVMYGHPSVFATASLNAARFARNSGYFVQIFPGISAEDCLFADLMIDPASCGCQSFDATDFLLFQRKFDPASHLVLWQPSIIGGIKHASLHDNRNGIFLLKKHLLNYYSPEKSVVLYEAAQYPRLDPKIQYHTLECLEQIVFSGISTLYIPPAYQSKPNLEILKALQMKVDIQ